jgi:hypothetical protein
MIPQKPSVALVADIPVVSIAAVVYTPILSVASVCRDHPSTVTAAIHTLEHNEFGEDVGEEDSNEDDGELLARHELENTDGMELDIAGTLAYPKH